MQDICTLAETGASTALYVGLAAAFIIIGALLLARYKMGVHYTYRGFMSLLLFGGFIFTLGLAPAPAFAQTADNCPPESSQTNQSGGTGSESDGGSQAAITCPENWVVVPGNAAYNTTDFCLMKYTASNVGGTATSQPTGQPWANISQTDAITAAQTAAPGAHLITENEWMTIAHNVLMQPANWCDPDGSNCGAAPGTAGKILAAGHNDADPNMPLEASADDSQACFGTVTPGINTPCGSEPGTQKRTLTLSNGEVIWDLVGNVAHWTSGQEEQGNLPSSGGSGGLMEYNLDTGMSFPVVDNEGTLAYVNPAVHNPAAANWGIAQQVGILYSGFSAGSPTLMAFGRGGAWGYGPGSGAFTLDLEATPSDSDEYLGFRSAL